MIDYFRERMSATGPGSPDLGEGLLLSMAMLVAMGLALFALVLLFLQYKKLIVDIDTIESRGLIVLLIIPWGIYLCIPVYYIGEIINRYKELGRGDD